MSDQIVAIETSYAGCRFRSRLEARWAVFFDHLGITWGYEPDGFATSAGNYLPDFRITMIVARTYRQVEWFEVKPDSYTGDDRRHRAFANETGANLTIARGMPRGAWSQPEHLTMLRPERADVTHPTRPGEMLSFRDHTEVAFHSSRHGIADLEIGRSRSRHVDAAYTAARSARFGS